MPMRHSKPFGGPHRPPANARKWCLCSMNWEVLKKGAKEKIEKRERQKNCSRHTQKNQDLNLEKMRTNIKATFPKLSLPLWIFHVFLVLFLIDIQTSALGIPKPFVTFFEHTVTFRPGCLAQFPLRPSICPCLLCWTCTAWSLIL